MERLSLQNVLLNGRIKELEKTKEDWTRETLDGLLKTFFTEEFDHLIDERLKKVSSRA